jgi:hypothetical protein
VHSAYYAFKRKDARTALGRRRSRPGSKVPPKEEPISSALALDLLRIELGYGLLPLINDVQGHRITDQIKALRRQLAQEMGFVMPAVRILDNMQLGANEYRIPHQGIRFRQGRTFPRQPVDHGSQGLARSICPAPPPPNRLSAARDLGFPAASRKKLRSAVSPVVRSRVPS